MELRFLSNMDSITSHVLAILVNESKDTCATQISKICKDLGLAISTKNIEQASDISNFYGQKGKRIHFFGEINGNATKIVFYGIGKIKEDKSSEWLKVGSGLFDRASQYKSVALFIPFKDQEILDIITGLEMKNFSIDKYVSATQENDKTNLTLLEVISDRDIEALQTTYDLECKSIVDSTNMCKEFCMEPPNVLYPESYANRIKEYLEPKGVRVEILGKSELEELGMGALLGVAQGSIFEPRLVIMEWRGGTETTDSPVAFVGKGVTFDCGGVSLKPPGGMWDMKYDMSGSAVVVSTINCLAQRKAKVNAVGVVALVENAIGHNAQRPSDIVKSMSGKYIEVLNTDAEGRLVLADALYYTQDRFKPKFMIDYATLTGAIVVALGSKMAGLFPNNDELSDNMVSAAKAVGEDVWRMPMNEDYSESVKSKIADLQNISFSRGDADSIVAAKFLEQFVNQVPWVHMDIAGVSWSSKGKTENLSKVGSTAFGVRLNNALVKNFYEESS